MVALNSCNPEFGYNIVPPRKEMREALKAAIAAHGTDWNNVSDDDAKRVATRVKLAKQARDNAAANQAAAARAERQKQWSDMHSRMLRDGTWLTRTETHCQIDSSGMQDASAEGFSGAP